MPYWRARAMVVARHPVMTAQRLVLPVIATAAGQRTLMGTFGKTEIAVPRARLAGPDGRTTEWRSQVLRRYQRRTRAVDALIAGSWPTPKLLSYC